MSYVANYAVLRFLPFAETDEFVNVGVAAHCAERRFLGTKLTDGCSRRVLEFFPDLDRDAFEGARKTILAELERIQLLITHERDRELGRRVFRELVRPRETVFRFGEIRTILTDDLDTLADRLFAQYVDRHFARRPDYQERVMAERYWKALRECSPVLIFHRDRDVGSDDYHVRVPIVSEAVGANGSPLRAIKPLDLNRANPTAVLEHGDSWIQRVRRLNEFKLLPDRFIFAVSEPAPGPCRDAAERIQLELDAAGATLVPAEDEPRLLEIATGR